MPGLQYIYVPLESASLIQRKHERDVHPPGLVTIENFISSRSDNVPTLRPDSIDYSSISLQAFRTILGDGATFVSEDEYLNSAFGLYGGDNLIFLTSRFPIDNSDDLSLGTYSGIEYSTVISKVVDNGSATAAVVDGSPYFVISDSAQINLNKKAWYGACVLFDGDDTYWPIRLVTDKSNAVLECPSDFTNATANFSIVQSHCPINTDYKFHTELFLSNSIYNTPIFDIPFSTQRMCGPFAGTINDVVDYVEYTGEFTEFTEAQSTSFQSQRGSLNSLYSEEMISRKSCASGNGIFISTKPAYENWGIEPYPDNWGPYYTITPEDTSTYLPPVDGGVLDFQALCDPTPYDFGDIISFTDSDNKEFGTRLKVIFDGTDKFYVPIMGTIVVDNGFGQPTAELRLIIVEIADDATPTTTAHITDYAPKGALGYYFEPGSSILNVCYNSTDDTIFVAWVENSAEITETIDEVIVVSTADWTTSVESLPSAIIPYGMEHSLTGDGVLVTGVDQQNDSQGVAHFYNCTSNSWSTLTNPTGDYPYYGCGIYDDGTNWVFTISGMDKLFYWGKENASTIVNTGSAFSSDLAAGAFRTVSNTFAYPVGMSTEYSTDVVLSGHDKVGIATVDPDTSSVSFTKLVDGGFPTWGGTYIAKFQRPIFGILSAPKYVTCGIVGVDSTDFSHGVTVIDASPGNYVNYYVDQFTPVSDIYRSKCYGIVNGYMVLFGLLEYDANNDVWDYTPRRIRWTAPATVNDFTSDGSGTADVLGNGEFIDARTVNERIVMFESNAISTLVPRGIVDDPFDYEVIHRGIRIASNPCVVNDIIYFIADDGLLYSTNGVTVEELGASFDLTKFDDFDEKRPAWLVYSVELNSLLAFYPNATSQTVYCISLANGCVTSFSIADFSDGYPVKSITAVESSSNISSFFNYNPQASGQTYDEVCSVSVLDTGESIDGIDTITKSASATTWYATLETGNLFNEKFPESIKIALKHIIVHTYTDSSVVTYNPDIIIEAKSVEDTEWSGANDTLADSAITITSTTAALSSSAPPTAFSNILGTANGSAQTYNLPWIAANCRIYTKTGSAYTACTLVTDTPDAVNEYQISGTKQIKVYGTNGHIVYCFCDNEPAVKVKAGDYVETTSGLMRITSITNYNTAVLYENSFDGLTGSHVYAEQIPVGTGSVKVAINKLVEGMKLRIRVVPRAGGGGTAPTIVKITGISLGYVPLGEKILEATGG